MAHRVQYYLPVAAIAGCVLAGLAGISFWSFLVSGLCLSLIALWDQEKLRPRFAAVGATSMLAMANLASVADAFLVSGAAWCAGCGWPVGRRCRRTSRWTTQGSCGASPRMVQIGRQQLRRT